MMFRFMSECVVPNKCGVFGNEAIDSADTQYKYKKWVNTAENVNTFWIGNNCYNCKRYFYL